MKTISGHLFMTKKEIQNINILLDHAKRDLSYREGGSYGDGDKIYTKEVKMAEQAIQDIMWVLETVVVSNKA